MAKLTEEKLFEAFGLGAKAQEVAAPAAKENPASADEGAQGQGLADPAAADAPSNAPDAEPTVDTGMQEDPAETAADGAGEDKPPLTEAERRANAARRRQQEQQAAVDKAVADALKKEREQNAQAMAAFFAKAGLKNTYTGAPITNMEEYKAWEKQSADKQLEADLKAGRLTPEGLAQAIGNHPLMQQAQSLIDRDAVAEQARQQAADQARIDAEIARIHEVDPSINSVADFMNMPNYDRFKELVDRGYSFEHAHYLVNREKIEASRAEAARQQAMANARGKEHLAPAAGSRGEGALPVPGNVMAMYRKLNPGMSEAQIIAHYNKVMKK